MKVVNSIWKNYIPGIKEYDNIFDKRVCFWLWWNNEIEKYRKKFYQIEYITKNKEEFLREFGYNADDKNLFFNIHCNKSNWNGYRFNINDMSDKKLRDKFVYKVIQYGYKLDFNCNSYE